MKHLIIILFLIFTVPATSGIRDYPKHQLGIGFSTVNGMGLSYQINISRLWSAKANGFAYYHAKTPPEDTHYYLNGGLQLQFNIFKQSKDRFYLFAGGSRWYFEERTPIRYIENDLEIFYISKKIGRMTNIGLGGGYEIIKGPIAFSFELGGQWQGSDKTDFSIIFDRNPSGTSYIGLSAAIGIRIYFD